MQHAVPVTPRLRLAGVRHDWRRPALLAVATLTAALPLGWWLAHARTARSVPVAQTSRAASFAIDPRFLDPLPTLDRATFAASAIRPLSLAIEPAATGSLTSGKPAVAAPNPAAPASAKAPLPIPRPTDLRSDPAVAARVKPRRSRSAELATPAEDGRSFLETVFGIGPTPTARYASLPAAPQTGGPGERLERAPEAAVAVYDIAARTVTLPNGERLEAHSGYGEHLDDPAAVHLRMRGATPPGTYDLVEREGRFHGVRALRLNPVGGSGAVHGRAGLLAHTFMLGPRGDSNGCVSFRDYGRFLDAYLRGDVRRLVVVPGGSWGGSTFAASLFGGSG